MSKGESRGVGGINQLEARRWGLNRDGEGCARDSGVRRFRYEAWWFDVIWVDLRRGVQRLSRREILELEGLADDKEAC